MKATALLMLECLLLQANVQSGSIRLADGGARLAERLAALHRDILKQEQLVMSKQTSPSTARSNTGHLPNSNSVPQQQPNRAQVDRHGASNIEAVSSSHLQHRRRDSDQASGQDGLPRHHADTRQPGRQDGRSGSDRGQHGAQQLAQHAEHDSRSSQQSEQGSRGNIEQGGRSGPDNGQGRGPGRGRKGGPDFNRYIKNCNSM